ncbi:hypothetical protein K1T71_001733 [Dendrolimus kikuchii]|uniref:Uncharacterized protein n=1 Tax=Dendrolimus kikuchii TaxID=765133 RepID=A0ACC1DF45_9NEOP|nr:hypothetical protein K1T71_001733 [Dendrolimus kikuchii]
MSAIKTYFKEEMQWNMIGLEHSKTADFYLSAWQTTRSTVPLLFWRALLFLGSVGIVLSSMIIYILNGKFAFWFIYLTHWGLTVIVLATGFSTLISARCYFYGPISAEFKLPWYVKTYWVLFNISVPLAFLITIFYWTLLYEAGIEEELNHGLDVAVHGLNSVVMFLLLASASQPTRLVHVYHPLVFSLVYVIFGIIYHLAGGVDQKGSPWIYPVVNWANPGTTLGVVAATGILLIVLHLITVGLAAGRDAISKKYIRPDAAIKVEEGLPLRRPIETTERS